MPAWKLDAMFSYYASKLNLEHGTASRGHNFIPAAGPYYGLCGMPRAISSRLVISSNLM